MYKSASRNLQHAHRVDRIDPSRGMVWRDSEMDVLPNAGNMSLAMCRDELRQNSVEMVKIDQALAMAKRQKDKDQIAFLGMQRSALTTRRQPIKTRQRDLLLEHDAGLLTEAINAILSKDVAKLVFEHAKNARQKLIDSATDIDL